MAIMAGQMNLPMTLYPQECSKVDRVGDEGFLEVAKEEFGKRCWRGTALTYERPDHQIINVESLFREVFKDCGTVLEIGTFRGVSTAMLAHLADRVITVDIMYYPEAAQLWKFFGVDAKIRFLVVDGDNSKMRAIEKLDFDMAFIDGVHTTEGVKFDFDLVKKCGKVVFHDYGIQRFGVTEFVHTLPTEEVEIKHPFAIWTRR